MFSHPIKLLAAAAALALSSQSVSATSLKYAHVGSEGDFQTVFADGVANAVDEASGGDLTIKVFPSSQLGNVAEMVDGVKLGSIDMGHHDFASLARIEPDIAVFNAPFIYRDGAHAMSATNPATSPVLQELNRKLVEKGGVRIIGRIYRGARHISSNFEIKSPADMKNKPFRAVPLDLWVSMIKGMSATPTPVEVAELPTALLTGLVVGQENPLTMLSANKLYEVQSHVTMTGHMQSILAVFINESKWQKLDEETQNAMTEVLEAQATQSYEAAQASEASLIEELTDNGMTFTTVDNGLDIEAFREGVHKQINIDFPQYEALIEQILAIE